MNASAVPDTALQLRSLVTVDGKLELSIVDVPTPQPGPNEVLVRIEGSPINPSDLGLLIGPADISTARLTSSRGRPVLTAPIPASSMDGMTARIGASLPVGNEGAGVVVAAGSSDDARALLGRTVAVLGGAMYSQYRCVPLEQTLLLPPGAPAAEGASSFVNPLTALGMVETMRAEGHAALVHTAAASNLGQMLVRLCRADGVPLVNIVRTPAQVGLLSGLGAAHVCDSSAPDFLADLTDALASTGATIAFDAIGGGKLGGQILACMEAALNRNADDYSRYGSTTDKQVYVYGGLDPSPTEFTRSFGMAWSMGGWLLTPFLQKAGPELAQRLKERVAAELTTTFASRYVREISLPQMLEPEIIAAYNRRSTGEKYLVNPNRA